MNNPAGPVVLAVDIGNSNIKFGVHRGGEWERRFRISTVRTKTPDEYGLSFRNLLAESGFSFADLSLAVLSCVVPPLTTVVGEMLEQQMGRKPLIVGPGIRTGIRIKTDNPVEVGSDIVANAVAAHERSAGRCVVIAFGTAITFSAVSEDGDLLGAAIAPGLRPAAESLVRDTAQLRLVEYTAPPSVLGRNTIHALQSGLVFGFIGMVEGIVARIEAELGGSSKIISTGDQARYLLPLTGSLGEFDPWLTLDGLRLIAERNSTVGNPSS